MPTIRIGSILGGHSPVTHFGKPGQFRASLGIDPAQPIDDLDSVYSTIACGLLRPAASQKFSGSTIGAAPLWQVTNPKDANVYVYDAAGSAYTLDAAFAGATALSDGGALSSSLGNGAEYSDNYIYFAKNTDIARYGPLNGAAAFNGSYWVTSLGMTALVNTVYPTDFKSSLRYPNHIMHRHSDGVLYIADVVGNKGALHTIQTSFGSAEGDTNNGSTFYKLTFGYGLWPTALESYGDQIAVALYEGSIANLKQQRAKLAFWDHTSTNFNQIIWVEFPDQIITAMKNIDGVLYVVSGSINNQGFRISKFVGGYSFQEVYYSETGEPCMPGAIDGTLSRLLFGGFTNIPESDGCVGSLGLQKNALGNGVFNVMRATGGNASTNVTSVCIADNTEFSFNIPIIGWTQAGEGSTGASHGFDKQATQYNNAPSLWWSDIIQIGQPFKITKIRIPLVQAMAVNMTLTLKIYTDDGIGTTYTYTVMNNNNFPSKRNIVLRCDANGVSPVGDHSFWMELKWTGSSLLTVNLPISIDFEVIQD